MFVSLHLNQLVESPEAPGWGQAETVQEDRLGFVGFRDATQRNATIGAALVSAGP